MQSKAKQYAQIRNWYTVKHQLTAMESEIIQYDNLVWDRIEQYLCQNKRDDKNSNWKSYKEVKAHLSDTQTKLIKSSKYFSFEFDCIFVIENIENIFNLY